MIGAEPGAPARRSLRLFGAEYPVEVPTWRDARLHLAAVILSLQFMGQAFLGFEVSVAQILVSILTAGVLEVALVLWRRRVLAWPASALLTGNGVAFLLRVPGTRHGDWWSLRGASVFAAVSAVSVLTKYVVRVDGRHVFNPSNAGLVAAFVVLGSRWVSPQDLWWGPLSPALTVTLVIIVGGGLAIVTRLRMLRVAIAFWLTFAAGMAIIAASGHAMSARWHLGPVSGFAFWTTLVASPEILVFLFFMITDPRTTPEGIRARTLFGVAVGASAAVLVAPQQTEYATKVAVLGGLAVVCAARPLVGRASASRLAGWVRSVSGAWRAIAAIGAAVAVGAVLVVAANGTRSTPPTVVVVRTGAQSARPKVSVGSLPPVTIDPSVRGVNAKIDDSAARAIERDLVSDLVIAGQAVRSRDSAVAATAAGDSWLDGIRQQVLTATLTGRAVVSDYRFDRVTIVLLRTRRWAAPELGARVTGTVRRVTYRGSAATATVQSNFSGTFVVVLTGRYYVIVGVDTNSS